MKLLLIVAAAVVAYLWWTSRGGGGSTYTWTASDRAIINRGSASNARTSQATGPALGGMFARARARSGLV